MLHSKEGAAAAAAEEWKRRGRRCCYGTIDARYLRKKDGRSGAEGRESRFLSRCSVALSPEKGERLTGQQRRRFVTVASPSSSSSSLYPRVESHTRHPLDSGAGGQGQLRSQRESHSFLPGGEALQFKGVARKFECSVVISRIASQSGDAGVLMLKKNSMAAARAIRGSPDNVHMASTKVRFYFSAFCLTPCLCTSESACLRPSSRRLEVI